MHCYHMWLHFPSFWHTWSGKTITKLRRELKNSPQQKPGATWIKWRWQYCFYTRTTRQAAGIGKVSKWRERLFCQLAWYLWDLKVVRKLVLLQWFPVFSECFMGDFDPFQTDLRIIYKWRPFWWRHSIFRLECYWRYHQITWLETWMQTMTTGPLVFCCWWPMLWS